MEIRKLRNEYIGDSKFYRHALVIIIPMILQNLVTNFVNMLDNIMVGQVGTAQMSGVSIVNQFTFVFNITIFGALSGAGIFSTQFFGKKDYKGQMYSTRFKIMITALITVAGVLVMKIFGDSLISLFLSKDDSPELISATLAYGREYLAVIAFSFIPFAIGQIYASTIRECGETRIPMAASIAAIGVNLILDYSLIFGKFGMPKMGVTGAAIATLIAKIIEAGVMVIWAHTHVERNQYVKGLYSGLYIPPELAKQIMIKGTPLLFNEFLWSLGMSIIAQCYSVRGIEVVAARNIASTLTNLFSCIFIQIGVGIGIIVGAKLGASEMEDAISTAKKLRFFSIASTFVITLLVLPLAYIFPTIYQTESYVKELASYYIVVQALAMPLWSYTNACYFCLRCGGKTGITFLFDFGFSYFMSIPLAFVLSYFTNMEIHMLFCVITFSELIKVIAGYFIVKSNVWVQNITV